MWHVLAEPLILPFHGCKIDRELKCIRFKGFVKFSQAAIFFVPPILFWSVNNPFLVTLSDSRWLDNTSSPAAVTIATGSLLSRVVSRWEKREDKKVSYEWSVLVNKTGICGHKSTLAVKDGWRRLCEKQNLIPVSNVFLNNSLENLLHVLVIDAKDSYRQSGRRISSTSAKQTIPSFISKTL